MWLTLLLLLVIRSRYLLPFEEEKLAAIRTKIYEANLAGARLEIKKKHAFPSPAFVTLKKFAESRLLIQEGEFLKAHSILFKIDENSLLIKEKSLLYLSRSCLYFGLENFRDSRQLLDKVNLDILDTESSRLQALLLRNELLLADNQIQEAKKLLEQAIEEDWSEAVSEASIYHSIALLECAYGNKSTALDLYNDAWSALKKTNRFQQQARTADNYIICLAIENKVNDAIKVLNEFESLLDYQNVNQLIEYLNIKSNLARQILNREMLLQAYRFSELEIQSKASGKQKLMLFVTQIKSAESDFFNIAPFVERAMKQLKKYTGILTLQERLNIYSEILSILINYLPDNKDAQNHFMSVYEQYRSAVDELNLSHVPINLTALRNRKLEHNNRLLSMSPDWLTEETSEKILKNHVELKNLRIAKNDVTGSLDSMMLIMAVCVGSGTVSTKFAKFYISTLKEADSLLEKNINIPSASLFFIGLAYFNYKQLLNYDRSLFWFNHFQSLRLSIHHQSLWHRDRYNEVKTWLEIMHGKEIKHD